MSGKPFTPERTRAAFWSKVDSSSAGCWPWQGAMAAGYGVARYQGRLVKAHRLAFIYATGEIPEGLCVCHRCDNPRCVNPAHLFLGTQADNQRDKNAKGRNVAPLMRGAAHGRSKLELHDVQLVRIAYAVGFTQKRIAGAVGVSFQQVSKIVKGQRWAGL